MIELDIEFREPVEWIRDIVKTHSASIKIRDIRMGRNGAMDLLEIFLPEGKMENFSHEMESRTKTAGNNFAIVDTSHATAIVDAHECSICSTILNWDLFLTGAYSNDSGNIRMNLLVPDEATINGFTGRLESDGIKFEILRKKALSKKNDITARQEYVVRTAFELGFFEYPKKINLEGLSTRLNVSYVTLAEILRRAEKNIISSYFKGKER